MIRYVVLGFLRDGRPRHGYALIKEAKAKLRVLTSSGSVYRELRLLERAGFVRVREAGIDEDGRRTPYVITESGDRAFLAWLRTPAPDLRGPEDDLSVRALFVGDAAGWESDRLLARWQEQRWLECKSLQREQAELIAASEDRTATRVQELLLTRRIARAVADLDLLTALCPRPAGHESGASTLEVVEPARRSSHVSSKHRG